MIKRVLLALLGVACVVTPALAEDKRLGEVVTQRNLTSPNNVVGINRIDDPKVSNVSCYVSRAEEGGWASYVNMQDDPTKFSIACRRTKEYSSKVCITEPFKNGDKLASKSANMWFKTVDVHRFLDPEKEQIVYVVISRKILDGANDNAVTAVAYDPGCSKL